MTALIIIFCVLSAFLIMFYLGCAKLERKEEKWRQLHPPDGNGGDPE